MAGPQQTTWHGTRKEHSALLAALQNNCGCSYGPMGERVGSPRAPHKALFEDQQWLNRMLFVRRLRARLKHEEFKP